MKMTENTDEIRMTVKKKWTMKKKYEKKNGRKKTGDCC